jgi:hypothetical protein
MAIVLSRLLLLKNKCSMKSMTYKRYPQYPQLPVDNSAAGDMGGRGSASAVKIVGASAAHKKRN